MLPRLLVIDDEYGRDPGDRNRNREAFCQRLGLQDVTGDVRARDVREPVADVVFESGQRKRNCYVENDLAGTLRRVRDGWTTRRRWSLLLLDLHFATGKVGADGRPHGNGTDRDPQQYFGLDVLERLWGDPDLRDIPVVILTSNVQDREYIEEQFSEQGVYDFVDKSEVDRDQLSDLITRYGLVEDDRIIGKSLPMLECLREARQRAQRGNENVLLLGETGTGKELLARYVHEQSGRDGNFVGVFTQGVTESLIEDRLFGHEKGSFTGAESARPGAAEQADGGTLFIDEFGNIPRSVQSKLHRLLDKNIRETQRQGSNEPTQVDLLAVLATNRMDILGSEDFYQDLLARAQARNPIFVPPLRERKEDIPLLTEHFVRKYEEQYDAEHRTITEDALDALTRHDWPENVRGLESVIEDAVARFKGIRRLSRTHLSLDRWADVPVGGEETPAQGAASERRADASPSAVDLEAVLDQLDACDPTELRREEFEGRLISLHRAYYRLVARLLDRALKETRSFKSGDFEYTNSVRLLVGSEHPRNGVESSTDAKRYVKRLLKLDEKLDTDLEFLTGILSTLPHLQEFLDEEAPKELRELLEDRMETAGDR